MPAACYATSWPVGHAHRRGPRRLEEAPPLSLRATRRYAARSRGISRRTSQTAFIGECSVARCQKAPQTLATRSLGSFRPPPPQPPRSRGRERGRRRAQERRGIATSPKPGTPWQTSPAGEGNSRGGRGAESPPDKLPPPGERFREGAASGGNARTGQAHRRAARRSEGRATTAPSTAGLSRRGHPTRQVQNGVPKGRRITSIFEIQKNGRCPFAVRHIHSAPALCAKLAAPSRIPLAQARSLDPLHRRRRTAVLVRGRPRYYEPVRLPLSVHPRRSPEASRCKVQGKQCSELL